MEKSRQSKKQSGDASGLVDIWSAQCGECFKWRLIPTQEEFEKIRSNLAEDPFICTRKPGVSCDDPADIDYDNTRTWVMDKPGLPKTPASFKRTLVMRKDFSKMDCYYESPNGQRLRSSTEVTKFLDQYPENNEGVSDSDFSFASPKIMNDTLP